MKVVNKWNFKLHMYEDAQIDDKCSMFETDMDKIIKCANCNSDVAFGETYTSRQYHNDTGFGYAVCEKCYQKEWKLYQKNKR